jgi:hypothetical protein
MFYSLQFRLYARDIDFGVAKGIIPGTFLATETPGGLGSHIASGERPAAGKPGKNLTKNIRGGTRINTPDWDLQGPLKRRVGAADEVARNVSKGTHSFNTAQSAAGVYCP